MANKLIRSIALFRRDPKYFLKVVSLRIGPRRTLRRKLLNSIQFEFDFSLGPIIEQMYIGEYERDTLDLMRRLLRPGDTFIDVGANIGYISAIGADLVGRDGQVHSFEPVPKYFQMLRNMSSLNPQHNIMVNKCALGEIEGEAEINIPNNSNIGWNTMVSNLMREGSIKETIKIPVRRLDQYIAHHNLENVSLIKIDTEGFEFPVLRGLSGYLDTAATLPSIICEVAPSSYPLLGHTLGQLSEFLSKYDYRAFRTPGGTERIEVTKLMNTSNVLFAPIQSSD